MTAEPKIIQLAQLSGGRESAARCYAHMQRKNNLFSGISKEDVIGYGRFLYDMCRGSPGCLASEEDGECLALFLQVDSEALDAVDPEVLGDNPCKSHIALCKELQRVTLEKFRTGHPEPCQVMYGVFGGIIPEYEGKGLFPNMQLASYKIVHNNGANYVWGFTQNPAIVHRYIKQKKGMNDDPDVTVKGKIPQEVSQLLINLPISRLRQLMEQNMTAGHKKHMREVYDTSTFEYNGVRPFKKRQVAWLGVYYTNPAQNHMEDSQMHKL